MTNNVFIFDYEGFGKSNGTPTEDNINADAEVALEYVASRMNVSVRITLAVEEMKRTGHGTNLISGANYSITRKSLQ